MRGGAARAEQRFGRPLPDDFQLSYRKRLLDRMAVELKPMDGALQLLPVRWRPQDLPWLRRCPRAQVPALMM